MTSATGERLLPGGKARGDARGGFTLIEIMVVMAIIVMLFGLVAVSMSQYLSRASKTATQALVLKLEQYLDEYKSLTGHYPPDGIDTEVRTDDGQVIKSTACLYYFLTRPVVVKKKVAGRARVREVEPIAKFQSSEVSPDDPDYPGVHELMDGYGTPMHYDNTEDGVFRPQRGEVHILPLDDDEHPPDPRDGTVEVDGEPVVPRAGVQSNAFDIWSHGEMGHDVDATPTAPIATWNTESS